MTMHPDDFGIRTRQAEWRARYGSRSCHGKIAGPVLVVAAAPRRPPPRPSLSAAAYECAYPTAIHPVAPTPHGVVARIISALAEHVGESSATAIGPRRSRHLAQPRQVAMWMAKAHTPLSLPAIGRMFGNRHHTTVMHACRKVDERLRGPRTQAAEREMVDSIARRAGLAEGLSPALAAPRLCVTADDLGGE